MFRFRKLLPVAAVAATVLLAAPRDARADFELRYSTDGGATWNSGGATSSNPGALTATFDGVTITATLHGFLSDALSTLDLSVSGTQLAQQYNLLVQATVTDVPTAPPPQVLSWKFTSSSDLSGLTETGQGWVDKNNVAFETTGGGIVATTGGLTAPASGSTLFSASPPYSWTEQYSLVGTGTLGNNISADNGERIAVPAPAGLVLALTGLPLLGVGSWLRRRAVQA